MNNDLIRVITIKASGTYETEEIKKGLYSHESMVDGGVEGLTLAGHKDFIMFVNKHGNVEENLPNMLATLFCSRLTRRTSTGYIFGDVVICGLDDEGISCSLTDDQIDRFITILKKYYLPAQKISKDINLQRLEYDLKNGSVNDKWRITNVLLAYGSKNG